MSTQLGESSMSDDQARDRVLWIYPANALFNEVDSYTITTMGPPAEFSSSAGLGCGF